MCRYSLKGRIFQVLFIALILGVGACRPMVKSVFRPPAEKSLVLATTLRTPPFSYKDFQTGVCCGIDIEIARQAAEKLGLTLEILPLEFPELLPAVKSTQADFAANSITITPARARDVNFSISYASDGSAFIYRVGDVCPTIPRARNLRVGSMLASTCHFYLCYHDIDPYSYSDYNAAFAEFEKGNLDTVFYDAEALRESVRKSKGAYAMSPLETRENYGFAIRKDFPELLEAVNQVILERSAK